MRRAPTAADGLRLLAVALTAWLAPAALAAQEGCEFGPEGNDVYRQVSVPGRGTISYVTNPHFVCEDGVQIWADSAVAYSDLGMSLLMGSVRYLDRTRELRADTARYFSDQGRIQATGHVYVRDETDGSEVENGDLVYLRQTDFRDEESMTVTTGPDGLRPRARVTPVAPDSASPSDDRPEPYTVVGDRIVLEGEASFVAVGTVEIEQDSLRAFADSAVYDQEGDDLVLDGSARVLSRGNELTGATITVVTPAADSSRIRARREAVLIGDGLRLTAPLVLVFLSAGDLERLVATPWTPEGDETPDSLDVVKPVAILDDAELTADSLDILAPAAVVQRVVAVGGARSVSTARDSLNVESLPEVAQSDWLEGDTVVVTFLPLDADAAEEETRYEIESIRAASGARALYRLSPSDTTARAGVDPPALHYVVGAEITITLREGEVEDIQVVGQTRGVHLEPLARRALSDTVADTVRMPTDTLGRGVDGGTARDPGGAQGGWEAPARSESRTPRGQEKPWIRE